jgi:spoIIIJ-associated protein
MQDLIKDTLTQLLEQLGLKFTDIRIDDTDETMIRVDIDSPEASRLIGWHGETINSIQHLLKSMIRSLKKLERAPFIVLDVDGYRKAQEEKVCRIAGEKAEFVRSKKTKVALPPMSPYFRRVVHLYVASSEDLQDITTESIGEGDYRQIVMTLKEGSMDEGEELVPSISKEEEETMKEAEGGFENLDV